MKLVCWSVSFHDAPVEAREKLAFSEDRQRQFLRGLRNLPQVSESLILCTCNRTEIYLSSLQPDQCGPAVEQIISQVEPEAVESWRQYRRRRIGTEAIEHLFAVAAGLDSQMLGEHQIISQLKSAYTIANEEQTTRFFFHRLMHRAFRASKDIRNRTDLQSGSVSIGAAAVELVWKQLSLPGAKVLLLGAGENAELVARLLIKVGISRLWIASRTRQSAEQLAAGLKFGEPVEMSRIGELLSQADLAVCSTASTAPVITVTEYAYLLSQRRSPIVLIDIAMPRDVEPQVGQLAQVRLFNLEDLNRQADARRTIQAEQVRLAGRIVAEHTQQFSAWLDSLQAADVVAQLAARYALLAEKETRRYKRYFDKSDHAQLQRFAESLVKKVLHGPISYLRNSDKEELTADQMQAVDLIRKMLLTEPERKKKT